MRVTNIRIYPISGNPSLLALADIVIDDGLSISDLRIVRLYDERLAVQYPISQQSSSSNIRHVCNPINRETQQVIDSAVISAYWKTIHGT